MRPLPVTLTVLSLLAVAGCGSRDEPAAGLSSRATAVHPPGPPAPRAPAGTTLRFASSDGKRLAGRYVPGLRSPAPAIVLVHQSHGGPDQWDPLIGYLHQAGYATLAYASRSAGELDERLLARDVRGAVAALARRSDVDAKRIALVGASIGASAVSWAIGTRPALRVRAAVGLSPAESPAFINAGTAGAFQPHDLLLMADRAEAAGADGLRQDAGGRGVTTVIVPTVGHGVALLPDAGVRARLLGWLGRRLGR
ncbi:MAG: alpha/beta hydrolase family protein [Solirubrobacteraceae bacterium]